MPLLEKITCWSANLLSYSGRVQQIKSIIFGIQTYWAEIFLFPKKVIKMINTICRTFLWTGSVSVSKKALVTWEKVCRPKAAGGLNILYLELWNKAAILKHLWDIARKKDCLWIQWIHTHYTKTRSLETITTPKAASWVIRKIMDTKDLILQHQGFHGNLSTRLLSVHAEKGFSINYVKLMPQIPKQIGKYSSKSNHSSKIPVYTLASFTTKACHSG